MKKELAAVTVGVAVEGGHPLFSLINWNKMIMTLYLSFMATYLWKHKLDWIFSFLLKGKYYWTGISLSPPFFIYGDSASITVGIG